MTANVQGSNVLDVLKKKMRATKEESEKYKEDCEDLQRKLQVEIMRREEVKNTVHHKQSYLCRQYHHAQTLNDILYNELHTPK